MKRLRKQKVSGEDLYVGIDLHKTRWHVTIRSKDVELFCSSIPGDWDALRRILDRYEANRIHAVYEAGCFGFWLYDRLIDYGIKTLVTPPSLVPQEYGNRVKTDRRDSRKLSMLLGKGLLKRVWVPSPKERYQRQVIRRRRQLIRARVRTQNRIKSELQFYGFSLPAPKGKWTQIYFDNLRRIRFGNRWMQHSFNRLLEQYELLSQLIDKQTKVLLDLAKTADYSERVKILTSIPGIGVITAMEVLLELQDVARFRRADQLAAYVGLTPCQHTSAGKVCMGRIPGIGKYSVRSALVESSWWLIRKDKALRRKYETIKARGGAKRAIVAVARILLLRIRRMLLDGQTYVFSEAF